MKEVLGIELVCDDKNFTVNLKRGGETLRELNKSLVSTVAQTRHVESGLSRAARSFRHVSTTVAALRYTVGDLTDLFIRLPGAVMNTYGKFERLQVLMQGLSTQTGAADRIKEAGDNVAYLVNMSKNAPFTIESLSDAFVKFKTGGIDPLNGSLQALVDANARFGGTSETLKRAAVAIQQMGGKGVISMEELRQQLGEAVPTAMRNMALGVGVSMAVLQKKIADGVVESREAISRMAVVMRFENEGAAKTMMQTWSGVQARLKTTWDLLVNDAAKSGFAQEVKSQMKELTIFLDSNAGKKMANDFGEALASLTRGLTASAKAIANHIDLIKGLVVAFGALRAGKALGGLGNSIAGGLFGVNLSGEQKSAEQLQQIRKNSLRNLISLKVQEEQQLRNFDVRRSQETARQNQEELVRTKAHLRAKLAERTAMARRAAEAEARYQFLSNTPRYGGAGARANDHSDPAFVARRSAENLNMQLRAMDSQIARAKRLAATQADLVKTTTQHAAAQQKLAGVTALTTARIAAQTAAMRVGGAALALVGGWVGAITLALSLGAMAWMKWGNSGKQAIKDVLSAAKSGIATSETVEQTRTLIDEKNDEIKRARIQLEVNKAARKQGYSASDDDANATIAQAEADIAELKKALSDSISQARVNDGAKAEARWQTLNQERVDEISGRYSASYNEVERKEQERLAELRLKNEKGTQEKITQVQAEAIAERRKLILDRDQELYESAKNATAEAEAERNKLIVAGANDEDLNQANAVLKAARASERERAENYRAAQEAMTTFQDLTGGKAPKKTPKTDAEKQADRIEAVLERVKNLREQIDEVGSGVFDTLLDPAAASLAGTEFEQLRKRILTLDQAMVKAGGTAGKVKEQTKDMVSSAALRDLAEMAIGLREATREIDLSLMGTDAERSQAQYDNEMKVMNAKFDALMKEVGDREDAAEKIKAIEDEKARYIVARTHQLARELETPLQSMTREWRDNFGTGVDNMVADWASESIDEIANFTETGKLEWRNMIASWLKDFNRIVLQKTLANSMDEWFGTAGTKIKEFLNSIGSGSSALGAASMQGVTAINPNSGLLSAGGQLLTHFNSLAPSLQTLNMAVGDLSKQGIAEMTKTTFKAALQSETNAMTERTASQAQTFALGSLTSATNAATAALTQLAAQSGGSSSSGLLGSLLSGGGGLAGLGSAGGASLGDSLGSMSNFIPTGPSFAFAKGGVMTSFGPVALRRYAKGGIASSPQLALYGEGSHNEAYVPLPDGRSIPVTMTGGGGVTPVSIEINVTQNSDGSSSTSTSASDQSSSWRIMAERVRAIVIDEVRNQRRYGGLVR